MHIVTSKDGTNIAYDMQGEGQAVILVAGFGDLCMVCQGVVDINIHYTKLRLLV